jgi:HK97 family phage major capsid protein
MLIDAKDRMEGAAFATGSGTNQPTGIWTALEANTNVELVTTTAATIGEIDIHNTYKAVPSRWRGRGTWLTHPTWALAVKRLGVNLSSTYTGNLAEAPLVDVLGRPVVTDDDAPSTSTTTVLDNLVIFGEFSNYVIVDRIGATIEFVPQVFGATNSRPIGARGWLLHWRVGADSVNDNAFRLLQDRTSA